MQKTIKNLTREDLVEIAMQNKKGKSLVDRIQIMTTKQCILKICRDEPTHKNIDIIRSASIQVKGVWFELIASE